MFELRDVMGIVIVCHMLQDAKSRSSMRDKWRHGDSYSPVEW